MSPPEAIAAHLRMDPQIFGLQQESNYRHFEVHQGSVARSISVGAAIRPRQLTATRDCGADTSSPVVVRRPQ